MRLLVLLALAAATAGAVTFPLLYLRSAWRSREVGRSTMAFSIVLAITLVLTLLGPFGLRLPRWAVALIFTAMAVTVWWRVVVLWRAQHRDDTGIAPSRPTLEEKS